MEVVKVIPPQISPDTSERMWQFFLKTSIPRLIEKEREKKLKEMEEVN